MKIEERTGKRESFWATFEVDAESGLHEAGIAMNSIRAFNQAQIVGTKLPGAKSSRLADELRDRTEIVRTHGAIVMVKEMSEQWGRKKDTDGRVTEMLGVTLTSEQLSFLGGCLDMYGQQTINHVAQTFNNYDGRAEAWARTVEGLIIPGMLEVISEHVTPFELPVSISIPPGYR